jgi:predicted HicB family RNase H-like nuclease
MTDVSAATLGDMVGEAGYALRLPKELKAELERLAKANRRSLNSEIVWRLEKSVAQEERP